MANRWWPSMVDPSPAGSVRRWLLSVNDGGQVVIHRLDADGKATDFAVCEVTALHRYIAEKLAGNGILFQHSARKVDRWLCGALFGWRLRHWSAVVAKLNGKSSPSKAVAKHVYGRCDFLDRFISWSRKGGYAVTPEAAALDALWTKDGGE